MISGKLEQQIDVRLAKNEKDSLKWTANPSYATKNIDIDLIAIHRIKTTLTLNRTAYVGMCISTNS